MTSVSRKRLEDGILRQMDIQNAMYPDKIPVLDVPGGLDPLEFSRIVADNFPVLLKNAVDFPALHWGVERFKQSIGHLQCQVAQTPYGNADSPLHGAIFVKPHVESMTVGQLIDKLETPNDNIVRYMQSQDDNINKEFELLLEKGDVASDIPWAKQVIGQNAEAVNLWIGNHKTTSRLHNDNYENVFTQITGEKTIYLIPPSDAYALDEKFLVDATYIASDDGDQDKFEIQIDGTDIRLPGNITREDLEKQYSRFDDKQKIMFPTVNPADPSTFNRVYRQYCKVYKVVVRPGDTLYIPALWYHQVCISDETQPSISINYWYPVSSMRSLWPSWDYLRVTSMLIRGYHDPYFFDEEDDDE